ncbi:RidA family protein, partial [Escherichia coli]|nr:RidA family protein [Escherichia coli]
VRLTYYIRDFDQAILPEIRGVRDRWVNTECPPASSLIGVAALFHPDVLIEVDAMAVIAEGETS